MVSDYWAVPFLATMHRIAADTDEAGALALAAGIDVELPDTLGFGDGLVDRRQPRRAPEALVDRAARRLLTQKVELGLLDADWTPEASVADAAGIDLDSPDNRALAREMAERSIMLLDAGHGAAAARRRPPALRTGGRRGPVRRRPADVHGVLRVPQPRAAALPGARSRHRDPERASTRCGPNCRTSRSCTSRAARSAATDRSGFAAAVAAAREADLCIAFVGDLAGLFGRGTSGEGCDVEDLRLPGVQADLLDALLDTGTPVVVVVVSGRPYALGDVAGRAAGLVQAFMPGEEGGPAIAGVLSGRISPGGKLPVQIPRHARRSAAHLPAATTRQR